MNIEITPQESQVVLAAFKSLYRAPDAPDDLKDFVGPLRQRILQGLRAETSAGAASEKAEKQAEKPKGPAKASRR